MKVVYGNDAVERLEVRLHPARQIAAAFWRRRHTFVRAGERVDRVWGEIVQRLGEAAQEAKKRRMLTMQRETHVGYAQIAQVLAQDDGFPVARRSNQ